MSGVWCQVYGDVRCVVMLECGDVRCVVMLGVW